MNRIPIMLALALSISLTSYDGSTTMSSDDTTITKETSIKTNTGHSDDLSEALNLILEDKL